MLNIVEVMNRRNKGEIYKVKDKENYYVYSADKKELVLADEKGGWDVSERITAHCTLETLLSLEFIIVPQWQDIREIMVRKNIGKVYEINIKRFGNRKFKLIERGGSDIYYELKDCITSELITNMTFLDEILNCKVREVIEE